MKLLLNFLTEFLLIPAYFVCIVLGIFVKLKPAPEGKKIVLVHGWFTPNFLYLVFKSYLEKRGFSVYLADLGLLVSDFNQDANNLKTYINKNKLKNFVLVGASGGALVSYIYLQKLDGWKRTSHFISIGAPFKGTPLAYLGFLSGSARQMIPKSRFLKELTNNSVLNPENILSISAKYDELVPSCSTKLPEVKHEEVPIFGHLVLQTISKEMFSLVEKYAR